MSKSLVIVESPAKAKTINKYLGTDYQVEASIGHIMDLPKNDIGVELKRRTFEPTLIVSPGKEKIVERLQKLAAKADSVYLAPDPDREGEAIAAHLSMQLKPMLKKGREHPAGDVQRDYAEGCEGGVPECTGGERKPCRRAADPESAGPAGGIPDLAAAVGQGAARLVGGAGADGGAAADRGTGAGDQRVCAGGVLADRIEVEACKRRRSLWRSLRAWKGCRREFPRGRTRRGKRRS